MVDFCWYSGTVDSCLSVSFNYNYMMHLQAYHLIHQPVFVVSQYCLMPGWWLASGDQRRLTGNGSTSEA